MNIPDYDMPLQLAGGENNAWTNNDITNYYLTVPRQNVETGFWLESDRMLSLDFSERSLEVQRGVVMEEFKQRCLNQPYGDIGHLLRPLAYQTHPYQWPTIGKELSHIANATLEEVKAFFFRFYAPNNAILAVTGNISFEEAVALVKKMATAKFDETIEAHLRLGVDGRHADQQVRGAVVLPHGTGKTVKVLVFAKGAKVDEALAAGADYAGGEELVPKIQKDGWLDFDVVVATPDMMGVVGRLGRVLGPKGLMPNPKAGTVTMDVTKAVNDIKAGKIEYRLDKANIIHVPVGKASFTEEQLDENFQTLMDAIVKAKPSAAKGQYLKSVVIASTMGPGVKINTTRFA